MLLNYSWFDNSKHVNIWILRTFYILVSGLWWELSYVAPKRWQKCWRRNVPNFQMWILGKPNFTSTRRTSEKKKNTSPPKICNSRKMIFGLLLKDFWCEFSFTTDKNCLTAFDSSWVSFKPCSAHRCYLALLRPQHLFFHDGTHNTWWLMPCNIIRYLFQDLP